MYWCYRTILRFSCPIYIKKGNYSGISFWGKNCSFILWDWSVRRQGARVCLRSVSLIQGLGYNLWDEGQGGLMCGGKWLEVMRCEVIDDLHKQSQASWLFIRCVFTNWQCYHDLRMELLAQCQKGHLSSICAGLVDGLGVSIGLNWTRGVSSWKKMQNYSVDKMGSGEQVLEGPWLCWYMHIYAYAWDYQDVC